MSDCLWTHSSCCVQSSPSKLILDNFFFFIYFFIVFGNVIWCLSVEVEDRRAVCSALTVRVLRPGCHRHTPRFTCQTERKLLYRLVWCSQEDRRLCALFGEAFLFAASHLMKDLKVERASLRTTLLLVVFVAWLKSSELDY